jgi:hypothetical protein
VTTAAGFDARACVVWDAVCRPIIIPLGVLLDDNHDLYHYLWQSVVEFDSVTLVAREPREKP